MQIFLGVGKNGGVLAVAGDDPSCKSSTLPSQSEPALFDAMMPIFLSWKCSRNFRLGKICVRNVKVFWIMVWFQNCYRYC